MSFSTASALLRGHWLIDKKWTKDHLPLVLKILKGEPVDFGYKRNETTQPLALSNTAGGAYGVGYYTDLSNIPDGSYAVLTIAGPILKYGDYCSYGSVDFAATINRLAYAGNISGVIINVDSPGGQAAGTATLADSIKACAAIKPVIGLVDDGLACSAGYWILSACTEIYATQKTDWFGSIGVYTTIMDVYGYFQSQGLKVRDVYAPQSTDKNLDYREALENNDDLLKEELSVLCQQFIDTVIVNRGDRLVADNWQSGKVFYTKDAIKIGLIDGQKSFSQAINRMTRLINSSTKNIQTQISNNMKFTEQFPNLSSILGMSAEVNTADITVDSFLGNASKLEALAAEKNVATADRTNLEAQLSTLQTAVTEKESAIITLTADKTSLEKHVETLTTANNELQTENERLGNLTAGNFTTTSTDKDQEEQSNLIVDPLAFDFEIEVRNRLK